MSKGSYLDAKAQAVPAVKAKRQQGIPSIDMGYKQIKLLQHPEAFDSLDVAFNPDSNANRAADF